MPFLAHFGLKEYPFTLMPNPDYYFPSHECANIIASLEFGLRRQTGIMKVVGEIGTGKTLLCRLLLRQLVERDRQAVAYINAPTANKELVIATVCEEFGIDIKTEPNPYSALSHFLVEQHAKGRMAVVVVDEAQALGRDGLEAIRLLSNLESERSKFLQIVLFGQTELDDLMGDPGLRQLNQRIAFSFNTKPLTHAETRSYVQHRVAKSRQDGVEYKVFTEGALALIASHSRGIPRLINILADKALLVAFAAGSPLVTRGHAEDAIND
ncbi:MAG: AAA family ATPase, partial [Rhodospirillales bacterium]|nr:AAA family ATPase [Rhodospirillales bacterium]